jgi:hypothetical protein
LFPEGASNVQRLKLYGEHLHADVLALLITSCKALRHFSYSQFSNSGGNCRPWNDEPHYKKQSLVIDFRVIIRALQQHHNIWRTLAIYNTGATDEKSATGWASASLAGLEKLEKVCLDASVLFEQTHWPRLDKVLPAYLNFLRLENTWSTLMNDFEERDGMLSVLESATKTFPALGIIDIQIDEEFWNREVANTWHVGMSTATSTITSFTISGVKVRYLDEDDDSVSDATFRWDLEEQA